MKWIVTKVEQLDIKTQKDWRVALKSLSKPHANMQAYLQRHRYCTWKKVHRCWLIRTELRPIKRNYQHPRIGAVDIIIIEYFHKRSFQIYLIEKSWNCSVSKILNIEHRNCSWRSKSPWVLKDLKKKKRSNKTACVWKNNEWIIVHKSMKIKK